MRDHLTELTPLAGRDEVLAATDHHPYAQLTSGNPQLRAFRAAGAVAWLTRWSRGVVGSALGDPEAALRIYLQLAERGELAGVRRINLPRLARQRLASLPVDEVDEWDFRWTRQPPPPQPGEQQVRRLDPAAAPQIEKLLDSAFPSTFTRPGDPQVNGWYGIWDGDQLVACAADRSRNGVGSLSAITVARDRQGQGLGGALTAAATRALLGEYDVVSLGVMVDNHHAVRLYRRLGFAGISPRSSANLLH